MKFRSLFDILNDARDVVDLFEGVETVEQMISKLERMKQRDRAEDILVNVQSLRISIDAALNDAMEMGSSFEPDDDEEDTLSEAELGELESDDDKKTEEVKKPEEAKTAQKT